jgi:hypothetical protein
MLFAQYGDIGAKGIPQGAIQNLLFVYILL